MGETQLRVDASFRAPRPHLPLGQVPFEKVLDAFIGHDVGNVNLYSLSVRRKSFLTPPAPDHFVTTFNKEEASYSATALQYLNQLMMGRVYGETPKSPPVPLRDKIIENIKSEPVESFEESIKNSVFDVLTDFSALYPNLVPALYFTLQGVGVQGIRAAINYSADTLEQARRGEFSKDDRSSIQIDKSHFARRHPNFGPKGEFEIQCSGEHVARTIIDQAAGAALIIVNGEKGEKIKTLIDGEYIDADIFDHVNDIFLVGHYNNRARKRDESTDVT